MVEVLWSMSPWDVLKKNEHLVMKYSAVNEIYKPMAK